MEALDKEPAEAGAPGAAAACINATQSAGHDTDHIMAMTLDIARDNPNAPTVTATAAQTPSGEEKPTLVGLSREELGEALGTIGVPQKQWRMRASQLWHWLYVRGVKEKIK